MTDYRQVAARLRWWKDKMMLPSGLPPLLDAAADRLDHAAAGREQLEQIRAWAAITPVNDDGYFAALRQVRAILGDPQ